MAELHVVGQLLGASGFGGKSVFCKWGITVGTTWELLEGFDEGQTQVNSEEEGDMATWAHPIDVHYCSKALTGWPKIYMQIWEQDSFGRNDICGYGFCHVPAAPGAYELQCHTWLPQGTLGERITAHFVGGGPRLKREEVVYSTEDRFRLQTTAAGVVHLELNVVAKDFDRHNVSFGP
uniref:B9 domain-containing protein 2 n=1 Tax=Tetraselmis sp. GSL018 TaxID=582737 RepID=A0A061RH44_9CHLO|eukprot:CAMPEP_0177616228 /NCGR_PEP_ID=MMETSP0419_2-20121207/24005_1 /TAXON_ID=582737 /ORGANISM="Tetraselmis sp., Strain GSL018" /LENGTH=177 /DNA_ID=CAMNT_0019114195 /DNA_START=287 /DNA_END=820 /DNA_ORIENTATION=+